MITLSIFEIIFVLIIFWIIGFVLGAFLSGLSWMKAIDEDDKQKHPERYQS